MFPCRTLYAHSGQQVEFHGIYALNPHALKTLSETSVDSGPHAYYIDLCQPSVATLVVPYSGAVICMDQIVQQALFVPPQMMVE